MTLRKTTELEKDVFTYLNALRESGTTNMFGAREYIEAEFDMDRKEAREYLSTWMRVFNKEGNYEEIESD